MKKRIRFSIGLVLGLSTLALQSEAQVFWHYSVSDGVDTMAGSFTTSGSFDDTQGTGEAWFRLKSWDSWYLNGVNLAGQFTNEDPSVSFEIVDDGFMWSRELQSITEFETGGFSARSPHPFITYSSVVIRLPGEGSSGYSDNVNLNSFVNVSIDATSVVFTPYAVPTPVPEPSSYGVAASLLVGGFIYLRRFGIKPSSNLV